MFKLDFKKAEEQGIKLPTSTGPQKNQESSGKNIYFCFIYYVKPLTVWITTNWKILQEMGIPDLVTCLLRNLYASQEETVLEMEQWTSCKLGKEYVKTAYCHPAYLTYMQSTSGEGKGTPLQYSCLENPMDGGTSQAAVHGVAKSQT